MKENGVFSLYERICHFWCFPCMKGFVIFIEYFCRVDWLDLVLLMEGLGEEVKARPGDENADADPNRNG